MKFLATPPVVVIVSRSCVDIVDRMQASDGHRDNQCDTHDATLLRVVEQLPSTCATLLRTVSDITVTMHALTGNSPSNHHMIISKQP